MYAAIHKCYHMPMILSRFFSLAPASRLRRPSRSACTWGGMCPWFWLVTHKYKTRDHSNRQFLTNESHEANVNLPRFLLSWMMLILSWSPTFADNLAKILRYTTAKVWFIKPSTLHDYSNCRFRREDRIPSRDGLFIIPEPARLETKMAAIQFTFEQAATL